MKNLSINIAKNVAINDLACTPNTIVLAKRTVSERNGEITTSVRYIEVCNVDKTDALTIVKSLLKYCVAEFLVCKEFEAEFADTNIKQRKLFNQFLSTNKIYRTNSEGKIVSAIESEVPLNQTALKVNNNHTIANCKKENLKAAIHQHAKAIVAQSKHISTITAKAETLETEATPEVKPEPKATKLKTAA
ncbi:MAG: hypothetical protein SNJ29_13705 [Rikenellaceae bacterium]